ncbi:MAG: zinc ribbon domain-containing protein [Lachnospiraceae bacterium]|nr:zinc ribbon domain-containing protein [Lachnospiraceae bacterium]
MKCRFCGAENPDGSKMCMECGTRFPSVSTVGARENPIKAMYSALEKDPNLSRAMMTPMTVAEHIGLMITALIASLVVSAITTVLLFVIAKTGEQGEVVSFMTIGAALIGLFALGAQWIALKRLSEYENLLTDAYKVFIFFIISSVLSEFIGIFAIAELILQIVYYYKLCHGMSELCRAFPELSGKWAAFFKIQAAFYAASLVTTIILLVAVGSESEMPYQAVERLQTVSKWTAILQIIMMIPSVWLILYFKRSKDSFIRASKKAE